MSLLTHLKLSYNSNKVIYMEKKQYVVRYKIGYNDRTKMVIIDAKDLNECKHKAFNWIYRIHDLRDINERNEVMLDLTNSE